HLSDLKQVGRARTGAIAKHISARGPGTRAACRSPIVEIRPGERRKEPGMVKKLAGLVALTLLGCQGQRAQEERPGHQVSGALSQAEIVAFLKAPPTSRWTRADDDIIAPIWLGDNAKGSMYAPLWRAAAPAIEDFVPAPPDGDCRKLKGTI